MGKLIFISLFLVCCFLPCKAQTTNCDELISYVLNNGRKLGTINESEIINSSWLKKIEGFSINNSTVVVAEIYLDENKLSSKKYIFCGIPSNNWNTFFFGRYAIGKSLGEKFHEYIFDYKCNCR
jgi:hypothetical protein